MQSERKMSITLWEIINNVLKGPLPTPDEIEQMSFAEKQELASCQEDIISQFKQEAITSLSSLSAKLKDLQLRIDWLASDKTMSPFVERAKFPILDTEEEIQKGIEALERQLAQLDRSARQGLRIGRRTQKKRF